MPTFLEPFERVREDAYNDALERLAGMLRRSKLETVTFIPDDKNRATARGGVAERLFLAGFTDEDIKSLIRPWVDTYMGGDAAEARRLIQIKPLERAASKTPKDVQMSKVYAAQGAIPWGEQMTQEQCQVYLRQVMTDPWFMRHFPEVRLEDVSFEFPRKEGKRPRSTCRTVGSSHVLRIAPSMKQMFCILHELTHAIVHMRWGQERVQAHGPEFCTTLLRLTYHRFGRHLGLMLQEGFEHEKVKTTPLRPSLKRPTGSPEAA